MCVGLLALVVPKFLAAVTIEIATRSSRARHGGPEGCPEVVTVHSAALGQCPDLPRDAHTTARGPPHATSYYATVPEECLKPDSSTDPTTIEVRPPKFLHGIRRALTNPRHPPNAGTVAGGARLEFVP